MKNYKTKRGITLLIFLMLIVGIGNIIYFNNSAQAYQEGNYYIEDFESFATGTKNLTSSISGSVWLTVNNVKGINGIANLDDSDNPKYFMSDGRYLDELDGWDSHAYKVSNVEYKYTWFNLSSNIANIRFNTTAEVNDNQPYINFYNGAASLMFYLRYDNADKNVEIRDKNDAVLADLDVGTITHNINPEVFVNFTSANNSYLITIVDWCQATGTDGPWGNATGYVWHTPSNSDYVASIRMCSPSTTNSFYVDGFTVEKPSVTYLWETGMSSYSKFGDVSIQPTSTVGISVTSGNAIIETEKKNYNIPIIVRQVALSVDDATDFSNLGMYARMGDIDLGNFDSVYVHPEFDDRVIVWKNVNLWYNDSNKLFEFNFIKTGGTPATYPNFRSTDIDNDGDTESYYSFDVNNFNGAYGEGTNSGYDLQYQVWYETSETYSEYGNVEIGNITTGLCTGKPFEYLWYYPEFLEFETNFKFEGILNAFDIYVSNVMYEHSNNLNNYQMYINGHNKGSPSYWMQDGTGNYILRWVQLDETIEDEKILVELHSEDGYTGWHHSNLQGAFGWSYKTWNWVLGIANAHNMFPSIKVHDNWDMWRNVIYDGTQCLVTPASCFWYTLIPEDEETPPEWSEDRVDVGINPLTENTTWERYSSISFTGSILTKSSPSYLQLWHGANQYIKHGWGGNGRNVKDCNLQNWRFSTSFLVENTDVIGIYELRLVRNSIIVARENFTIVDLADYLKTGHLYTFPNPSPSKSFTIGWLYQDESHDNNTGAILYSYTNEFKQSNQLIMQNLKVNGSTTWIAPNEGTVYMWLCTYYEDIYHILRPHIHIIGLPSTAPNIHVKYDDVYLDDYSNGIFTQEFFGGHNLLGQKVWVEDNGEMIGSYLGNSPIIDFTFDYTESGSHTIVLYHWDGTYGTKTALDQTSFIINEGDKPTDLIITENMDFFIGFAILFIFIMIGIGIATKLKGESQLGIILLFAVIGGIIPTVLKLFLIWIPFLISLLLGAYIVDRVFTNK